MELYGGTANVLADEFRRWVGGLFQGKSLAFILAGTSILISFGFFYAANHLQPRLRIPRTMKTILLKRTNLRGS